jgi:hypothetical protein
MPRGIQKYLSINTNILMNDAQELMHQRLEFRHDANATAKNSVFAKV